MGILDKDLPVVCKNNSALKISTIRAISSDVRSTLRVGRIADVTSTESRRNNVYYTFVGNSLILQRRDLWRSISFLRSIGRISCIRNRRALTGPCPFTPPPYAYTFEVLKCFELSP
jgi:hypothetical protein